jgi:hypothetical protein
MLLKHDMVNFHNFLKNLSNFKVPSRKPGKEITLSNQNQTSEKKSSTVSLIQIERTLERRDSKRMSIKHRDRPILEKKQTFNNFSKKIDNLNYKGFQYNINEDDFFKRPDGNIVGSILNNELAAIKKCEELCSILSENEEYFDLDFGDKIHDHGTLGRKSLYFDGKASKDTANNIKVDSISWYKTRLLCPGKKPVFLDNVASNCEILKGALKNNWFLSALQIISSKDHLLKGEFRMEIFNDSYINNKSEAYMLSTGVYPPIFHEFAKKGLFCFKFYKNFRWRYVIVDDRIPCLNSKHNTPKPIYGKCRQENHFWVSLIEKAYAKLHGGYEALNNGNIL